MKSSFYKNISAEKGKCNCSDGLHAPNPVSRGMKESHVKTWKCLIFEIETFSLRLYTFFTNPAA